MIDHLKLYEELKETIDPSAAKKIVEALKDIYEDLRDGIIREGFRDIKSTLSDFSERLLTFQRTSEENFNRVWKAIGDLAEAQRRTEERVNELAEALKETQRELKILVKGLAETSEMVGGLSDTVGYSLEDREIKSLPSILKNKYGIIVIGLVRKFIKYNGRYDEVNILGTGKKDRRLITIIGEAKSRLSKKHIGELLKLIERLRKAGVIQKEVFPIVVTYAAEPVVEEMAKERGVNLIWSYEL